jgi:DNA polymerase-1
VREAVRAFDIPCLEQGGFEADDLIATYARIACEANATATIVSSDKDLMQLVNDCVVMYDTMKDVRIGAKEVVQKFGVGPDKVIEVQALIGDSVDNVPGVSGIGPKAAATLISEFGSLDEIFKFKAKPEALDERLTKRLAELQAEIDKLAGEAVKLSAGTQIAQILKSKFGVTDLPPDKKGNPTASSEKVEELAAAGNRFCELVIRARSISRTIGGTIRKLIEGEEAALLSRKLVTLASDVPLDVPADDLLVHEPDYKRLLAFLKAMEFSTLTRRVAEKSGIDAAGIEASGKLAPHEVAIKSPVPEVAGPVRVPMSGMLPLTGGGMAKPAGTSAARPAGNGVVLSPQAFAAAQAAAARARPFDRSKYEIVRSLDRLSAWILRARETGLLAIDTEATSADPMVAELCGISLAVADNDACYVPLGHREGGAGGDLFAPDAKLCPGQIPEGAALEALKPLLEDRSVLKIGQDFKFDWQIFARRGIEVQPYEDTMLMSYVLDAGKGGHGMDDLAERWLGHQTIHLDHVVGTGKSQVRFDRVAIEKAAEYSAEDADVALRLWKTLKARLAAEHVTAVYETLERPLVPVLGRMERRGISIDRQVLSRLSGEFAQRQGGLEDEINKLAGAPINPGSPKQLGDILFGKMGLPGGSKTKTGQWATGAKVLEELAEQGHELPQKILDWRQVSKLRSTYTDALPDYVNAETHRVHTSYALASTSTGRLSSSEPNLQNIPIRTEEGRKIRRAFIAAPGTKLVSADYSQIELRLLAEIADIAVLKKAFRDGLDIHAMTASEMFGVPIKDMPGEVRRRAKAINFGIIYGISAFGLANQLGIEREEAGAYIKKYFERFPGIRDYMEATKAFCKQHGYVLTLFGRKCHYPDIKASNASIRAFNERAAINARLQGTAADIIRRAMIRIEPALAKAKLDAQMLLQVHDELIFEVPEGEVARTLPVIKRVMEDAPMPALSLSVPLAVDARAAGNWDEAH